ncbi:putative RNA recognition motif domain, mei2/Mei2-like RNA recognition [Helianthus annuus]|nr:putative RNA recognition motif domain, mei2-like RNA recognition, RNA-binding domain superfamily [Helianthus annuus]KAJ0822891.1 putative RNA recognition motif domain, mei2/Mei2-like RNA recognition [Helianthus annuus]
MKSMNFSKAVRSGMLSGSDDVTLFSSSLPVLPHEKLILNNTENGYQQSVETNDLLEDNAIGSLLPNEDDLLAGVLNGFDYNLTSNLVDESEDFDLFGSGGGMEMEYDMIDNLNFGMSKVSLGDGVIVNGGAQYMSNGVGPVTVEHPYGEHPSRTLFVRNINSNVEDLELRALFEQYGDIRTLYTACKHRGFVMISYYDIRDARTAMRALQNKPLRRRKLDIHYSIPKENPSDKDINQGTLVVFNLDPSVSCDDLLQIFGAYGEVREIRETPYKRHHKFIEYYDVRDAEAALRSLNRCDIAGKRIKLEPSRPGGYRRNQMLQLSHEFDQDDTRSFRLQADPLIANSPVFASLSPNGLPGLVSILHTQPARISPIGKDHIRTSYVDQTFSNGYSMQDHNLSYLSGSMPAYGASGSTTSGIETLSGPEFLWGSPNKPSHGFPTTAQSPTTVHPFTGQLGPGPGPFLSSSQLHHHVGSAPSGLAFDRHFSQNHEPPETLFMSPPTFVGIGLVPCGSVNVMENGSPGFSNMSPKLMGHMFLGSEHYVGPGSIDLDSMSEDVHARNCWVDHNANQMDIKKQFQLDLDKISNGEDNRTTLMIKNIPNKYTSKMLLAAINENHSGTYDFLYLPIDFKNKCNVGYAFINMLSPMHIIPFYQVFNGKKWDKFNSGKVASLAYARIQGKAALVTHFQNSSLIYEDKRCWPILFQSEGSDAVDQEYLPSSSLNTQDHPYSGDPLASPSPPDDW